MHRRTRRGACARARARARTRRHVCVLCHARAPSEGAIRKLAVRQAPEKRQYCKAESARTGTP
eukprot:6369503-Alexandrium_andersonii.AAC.1